MCLPLSDDQNSVLLAFKQWILSQEHFVRPQLGKLCNHSPFTHSFASEHKFLLRFLRNRKFNLKESCEMFENYLMARSTHPHCFKNLDINDSGVFDLFRRGYLFPLLEPDAQGRTVIFARSAVFSEKFGHKPSDLFRAITMTFEMLLDDEHNQTNGFVYIFDQQNVSLSQISYLGIREMQLLLQRGEKSMPVRHKEIHWFRLPFLASTIFYFVASFVTEKLRRRLHFHNDLKSLHERVPDNILPFEYGGKVSWKFMAEKWLRHLEANRDKLISLDSMSIN